MQVDFLMAWAPSFQKSRGRVVSLSKSRKAFFVSNFCILHWHIFPDIQKLLYCWLLLLLNDVQSMLIVDFWCLSLLTVQYSPTYLRGWYLESQSSVAASHKVVDAGVKELFPPFLLQHVGVPDGTDGTQQRCIGNSEYGRKWTWWRCLQTIFEIKYFNSRINDTVDTYFSTLKNFDYCNFLYISIPTNKLHHEVPQLEFEQQARSPKRPRWSRVTIGRFDRWAWFLGRNDLPNRGAYTI